jgi:acyl-CoA reductase-like NAD-dependent aldehyde dehydrogenase
MKTYPVILGGAKKETGEIAEVRFPYTGEIYAKVCLASHDDINEAVAAAVRGYQKTRTLSSGIRSRILYRLADAIRDRDDELIDVMVMEGGKTKKFAVNEVSRAEVTVRTSAEEAKRIYGKIIPLDWTDDTEGRTGFLQRFPIGPVVGIVPFNFPLNLACHKLAPAIAAGNSIILKPASATPVCSLLLGELVLEAGLPQEAISVVPCPHDRAEQLVRDPRVAYLSFTGSCSVGWHLREIAGRKKAGLELGGNAAVIVHEDANLDFAATRIVTGGFINAGQVCISVQRVLVHRPVYKRTLEKILFAVQALKVGDPRESSTDVGPMIDEGKAQEAYRKVQEAVEQGAQVVAGGTREGTLFAPTVIVDTTPDMSVNQDEVFAPVISVSPYDDFSQALSLANAGNFGLQAGVFTQNINRVMRAFNEMEVGGVIVNDIPTFRVDQMPYGGIKGSGTGREGPKYAIEEMTEIRLMVINRNGGMEQER